MKQFLVWLFVLAMFSACALGEAPSGKIAPQEDMTDVIDIVDETMVPVTAEMLLEGYYPAEVDSSSSMFKVTGCFISVSNGMISAKLYMKSQSYSYMYAGTAEEAAAADRSALVMLEQDEDGYYYYRLDLMETATTADNKTISTLPDCPPNASRTATKGDSTNINGCKCIDSTPKWSGSACVQCKITSDCGDITNG